MMRPLPIGISTSAALPASLSVPRAQPEITIFERYALERQLRQMLVALQSEVDEVSNQGIITHAPLGHSMFEQVHP